MKKCLFILWMLVFTTFVGFAQTVRGYEYWFDNDYAGRTTTISSQQRLSLSMDIGGISPGLHYFNFRAQGTDGKWGCLSRYIVYINNHANHLSRVDYWFDGKIDGKKSQEVNGNSVLISVDISQMERGKHTLAFQGFTERGSFAMLDSLEFDAIDAPIAPMPVISYEGNIISISIADPTATTLPVFYYTLDGTDPDITSTKYEGPFEVTHNCVVKSVSYLDGAKNSPVDSLVVNWFKCEKPVVTWNGKQLSITTETEGADIYYSVKEYESSPTGSGTEADPYNVAAAIAKCKEVGGTATVETYYVKGIVSQVSSQYDTTYGNALFYISDNGSHKNDFMAYRANYIGNQKYTDGQRQIQVGDDVVLCGQLVNYNGNTPETATGGYLVSMEEPELTTKYENPIEVSGNVVIRAKATKQDMTDSDVAITSTGVEPYAVLDGTTLTFYYDDQKGSRGGMDVEPFSIPGDRRWESVAASVTTVAFDESMANCTSLTSTAYWFYGFSGLTAITGIGNLKTDNVTDMQYMFYDCNLLTNIELTGFNTTNVTNMRGMFYKCQQLQSLDLSSFNTALVTDMSWMFYGCNALTKIYAGSEWTAEGVVTDEDNAMFMNCTKLVGGAGTTYDETHADHTYAHIDGGVDNPGYFTDKDASGSSTVLDIDFTQGQGEWTIVNAVSLPDNLSSVWQNTAQYGMKASGYSGGVNYATDSWLISPEFTLASEGTMAISHAQNHATSGSTDLHIMVSSTYASGAINASEWTEVTPDQWPDGTSWLFINSTATIPAGTTRVAFRYTSTETQASTWEIKSVSIKGQALPSAVKPTFSWNGDQLTMTTETDGADIYYSVKEYEAEPAGDGSESNPYNVAGVLKYISTLGADVQSEQEVYVKGVVSLISSQYDTTYGNGIFCISDNGENHNNLKAYQALYLQNQKYSDDSQRKIQVGDDVVLCGKVVNYKGNTPETVSRAAYLYSMEEPDLQNRYENPITVSGNVVIRAKATMQGMEDSGLAMTYSGTEPYAVLSDNNTVLTFRYDDQKRANGGMGVGPFGVTFINDENAHNVTGREWEDYVSTIRTVAFDPSFANCSTIFSTAGWFCNDSNLVAIRGIEYLNTDNVMDMTGMFCGCKSLTSIDLSHFNTSNVTNMWAMFNRCESFTTFNLEQFNTSKVTDMRGMFYGCSSLTNLDLSHFDVSKVIYFNSMFRECTKLENLNLTGWRTSSAQVMRVMFGKCESLKSIDLSGFDTSNATNLLQMFYGCTSLTSIDVSKFNTEKVTTMNAMFWGCTDLTSLVVSSFNTANVQDMGGLFYGCSGLTSLDLSKFNTANVTNMSGMFYNCSSLTSLDVSKFNTEKVTNMNSMFYGCSGLTSLDVSKFNTANVTTMNAMFFGCSGLTSLDISSFNTANVTDMSFMFYECSKLKTIYAGSGWSTVNVTEGGSMFYGCTSLVGGADTVYDERLVDYTYARIDGGPNSQTPGYFTAKSTAGGLEIYAIEKGATVTPNQPITATQSIIVTPGNDSEWLTDMSMGSAWENPLEFTASIYYPNSSATHTFVNSMRGTNNPKDGELTDGVSSGNGYKHTQKNLPQSGGFLVFEALQNGSLIVPVRVFANKQFYVVDANGKTKTDIQFKDADGNTLSLMTDPLCAVSTEEITGFVSFNVVQGEKYYIFCTGSKVRFGGYVFSPESITIDPATMANVKPILEAEPYAVLDGTTLTFYYDDKKAANNGMDVGPFSIYTDREWDNVASKITNVIFDSSFANATTLTSTAYWFWNCNKLESIEGIQNLNTANITTMQCMFTGCSSLSTLDVRNFNTDKVTNMGQMFSGCSALTNLDLSNFNTSLVYNFWSMFFECSGLKNLDLRNFNTSNLEYINMMFYGCSGLTSLDISNFNTEKVTGMFGMFNGCSNLVNLDMSNFKTNNVQDMHDLFAGCSSLASIQAGNAAIPDSIYAQIGNPNLLLYVNEASLAPASVTNVVVDGAAENIVLTDVEQGNNNFYCPQEFTARRISYTHNYRQATQVGVSRGWETIVLPFTVQTITHEKNGPLAPFGVDGGKPFWLRQLTENGLVSAQQIEANMPYLISMPNNGRYPADYNQAGNVTFSANNVVVPMTEQREMSGNNRMLIPTTMRVAQSPSVYAINRNASYENNPEGSIFVADYREVRPFEAYVEHTNGARFFTLSDLAEGDVTDIQAIHDIASADVVKVYNLSGVLLKTGKRQEVMSQLPKGIYIVNGVKVVVK